MTMSLVSRGYGSVSIGPFFVSIVVGKSSIGQLHTYSIPFFFKRSSVFSVSVSPGLSQPIGCLPVKDLISSTAAAISASSSSREC